MPRDVVIGLGDPLRRHDGVGPATAKGIARRGLPGVEAVVFSGDDPAALLDTWRGARLAVVLEAVRCPGCSSPGSVHRIDPSQLPPTGPATSSHGIGLATAYRLSGVLGARPTRLAVVGCRSPTPASVTVSHPPWPQHCPRQLTTAELGS